MPKYDDYDWDELPKNVQEAAKKLGCVLSGIRLQVVSFVLISTVKTDHSLSLFRLVCFRYTKGLWDADKDPEETDEYWKDLTPEQQEAAKILGYGTSMQETKDDENFVVILRVLKMTMLLAAFFFPLIEYR